MTILVLIPAFSITGAVTGFYFPNEKIAGAVALFWFLLAVPSDRLSSQLASAWIAFTLMAANIGLKVLMHDHHFSTADINLLYWLLIIPIYMSLIIRQTSTFIRTIFAAFFINVLVIVFQWSATIGGYTDLAMIFNNYPPQANYTYPVFGPIVRVAGLFHESSQLSLFLLLIFAISLHSPHHNKGPHFPTWVMILSLLFVLLTFSATAILGVFFLLFAATIDPRVKRSRVLISTVILVTVGLLFSDYAYQALARLYRMAFVVDRTAMESERSLSATTKIMDVFAEGRWLLGRAQSWVRPSFDFVSIYLYGYGVYGFLVLSVTVFFLIKGISSVFLSLIFVGLLGNGNLLIPINTILLCAAFAFAHQSSKRSIV